MEKLHLVMSTKSRNLMGKNIGFIIITLLLMMIILTCFSMNVYSQSMENKIMADKEQTDLLEKAYLKEMKHILSHYGCENAGVTMTKVYGEDINSYEVAIHHSNLRFLDDTGKAQLLMQLQNLVKNFPCAVFVFHFSD
ncbi:MAG: hypothetical protein J6A11_11235 [Lachnospiraceae bacterium]|nr:hypothetical protein [Lachnospiraceae bacterium]